MPENDKNTIDSVELLRNMVSLQEQVKSIVSIVVESKKEDREDRQLLRSDLDVLAKSMTQLSITSEKHLVHQTYLESDIREIKDDLHEFKTKDFSQLAETTQIHGKILAGNKVRWLILGSVLVTAVGFVFNLANNTLETVLEPLAKNTEAQLLQIQNTQQMLSIQQQILENLMAGERDE